MSAIVFVGPSLRPEDLSAYPHIRPLPPVRQGDVYRAIQSGAAAIGIVDGYFDGQPAVWHKEILWALTQGIAVFGAASMGALRAAELHGFGMVGIGRIFEDYRDEIRTDDDDVALVHGPAELGFVALTEPMVTIDATLETAVDEAVISADLAETIRQVAKAQFYQARTWESVLGALPETAPVAGFATWLEGGKVDRKRADALDLLAALDDHLRSGEPAPAPSFSFEFTQSWADAPWRSGAGPDEEDRDADAILNELRLDPDAYTAMRDNALLDWLAAAEIDRSGRETDRRSVRRVMHGFRDLNGLYRKQDVADWAARNDSDLGHTQALIEHHAALEDLAGDLDARLRPLILDRLRWAGLYPRLKDRARRKASLSPPSADGAMPPRALLRWYFEERCDTDIPDDLDAYARSIGLAGSEDLHTMLAGEYALLASGRNDDGLGAETR